MEQKSINRARIIELADKMTVILDLVPKINTAVSDQSIINQMKVAAKLIVETDLEKFDQQDIDDLKLLGIDLTTEKEIETPEDELTGQQIVDSLKVPETPEEESSELTAATASVVSANSEQQVQALAVDANLITQDDVRTLLSIADKKSRAPYLKRVVELILKGNITREQVVNLIVQEMPDAKESAVKAALLDSKNPKYSRFKPYYLVEDSDGHLYFAKSTD